MCQKLRLPKKPPILCLYLLWGFLFVFFYITIACLNSAGNIHWTKGFIGKTCLLSLLFGSVLAFLVRLLLGFALNALPHNNSLSVPSKISLRTTFLCGLIISVFQIPAWLAFYPGICAYDTPVQLEQIFLPAYNEHHPLLHTLLLRFFLWLGSTFGTAGDGIAIFSIIQLFLLSFTCGYSIAFGEKILLRIGANKKASLGTVCAMTALYILFPFQSFMSLSVTKDIPFTICFMLAVIILFDLLLFTEDADLCHYLLFSLSILGILLFRNNGKYAVLVPNLLLLLNAFVLRKKEYPNKKIYKRILSCLAGSLLVGVLLLRMLSQLTNAASADRREMLSLPIQQLARVMIYHGGVGVLPEDDNTLSPQDKDVINDFLLYESYCLYKPSISDPVKRNTNTSVILRRTKEFFSTYLGLAVTYPGDYINAALGTNAGFLSPGDVTHAAVNQSDILTGLGYIQTRWDEPNLNKYGIYKASKWQSLHDVMDKWASENGYLDIPLFGYLLRPGNYLWFFLLLAIGYLEAKNYSALLPISLILAYFATMFFGPTVQLRYIYPTMMVLPACIFAALIIYSNQPKE